MVRESVVHAGLGPCQDSMELVIAMYHHCKQLLMIQVLDGCVVLMDLVFSSGDTRGGSGASM